MLLYGLGGPGPVESAQFCATYPGRGCVEVMSSLQSVPPNRDILRALSQLIMAREWYFTTNSTSTPYELAQAFLQHAPADRVLATSILSRAILDDTFGAPIDLMISGLVANLSMSIPEDIRARSILNLTALADDSASQWRTNAQRALAQVAHLTAAPTPPVVKPGGGSDSDTNTSTGPSSPRPSSSASRIAIAGFVGAAAIAAVAIGASLMRR